MYRLMVDTNVLLDLLSADRPRHREVSHLFAAAFEQWNCELFALAPSLKDVYYIYARHYGSENAARRNVRLLSKVLTLCACDAELVQRALLCDEPDFEDGLVRCAAERAMLDGIVTRDKAGFDASPVKKLSPLEATVLVSA